MKEKLEKPRRYSGWVEAHNNGHSCYALESVYFKKEEETDQEESNEKTPSQEEKTL